MHLLFVCFAYSYKLGYTAWWVKVMFFMMKQPSWESLFNNCLGMLTHWLLSWMKKRDTLLSLKMENNIPASEAFYILWKLWMENKILMQLSKLLHYLAIVHIALQTDLEGHSAHLLEDSELVSIKSLSYMLANCSTSCLLHIIVSL